MANIREQVLLKEIGRLRRELEETSKELAKHVKLVMDPKRWSKWLLAGVIVMFAFGLGTIVGHYGWFIR